MLTTDIVIVIPAHRDGFRGAREEYLGPDYIDAYLRSKGFSSCVLNADFYGLTYREAAQYCIDKKAAVIGLSIMQPAIRQAVMLTRELRARGFTGSIVAGGHYPTLCTRETFALLPALNFIVRGEGEITFCRLCAALLSGENGRGIEGLSFLSGSGELIINPPGKLVENLDELPFPTRTILPDVLERGDYYHADILGSRGCPYHCSFCGVNPFYASCRGVKFRKRSMANVADEIAYLKKRFKLDDFHFSDEIFCPHQADSGKTPEIAVEFGKRNLQIRFAADFRVTDINPGVLTQLRKAGLFFVRLGVESGSQETLDHFNKKTTVQENKEAILTARKMGFGLHIMYIMFEPYSTLKTIREALNFFKRYCMDQKIFYIFFHFMAYDGLPLTEELRSKNLLLPQSPLIGYNSYRMTRDVEVLYHMMTLLRKKCIEPVFRENDRLRVLFTKHNTDDKYQPVLRQLKYFEKMISRLTIVLVQKLLDLVARKISTGRFRKIFFMLVNRLCGIGEYQKTLYKMDLGEVKYSAANLILTSIPGSADYEVYNPAIREAQSINPQKMQIVNLLRRYGLQKTMEISGEKNGAAMAEIKNLNKWFAENDHKTVPHENYPFCTAPELWKLLIERYYETECSHTA